MSLSRTVVVLFVFLLFYLSILVHDSNMKKIVVSNQVIVIYSTVYFSEAVHCSKTVMYQWKYCYHNDNYS